MICSHARLTLLNIIINTLRPGNVIAVNNKNLSYRSLPGASLRCLAISCTVLGVSAMAQDNAEPAPTRAIETCANGEPTTSRGLPDGDADGVADALDNCRDVPNAAQRDTDGDGFGNLCDADINGDNVVNVVDLSVLRSQFLKDDPNPHADLDGDGIVSVTDLAILRLSFFAPPGPTGACNDTPELCEGPLHFEASDDQDAPTGNLFVIRATDPASIYHGRRLLSGASECNPAIAGYTFLGTKPWNPDWGFHISGEIFFHGNSLNAPVGCNRSASFIESNLGMWCNIDTSPTDPACQFWCPWSSGLTREVTVASERE